METLSSTCPEDFRREQIFIIIFLKKIFGLWEKSFQTFGVLLMGRAFNRSIFFCQRNFVKRKDFFQVNEITIKIFWPPTVSFLEFWRKSLAGFLESNYSCPEDFSAKKLLFHRNSYFHFWDTGRTIFKTLSYFVRRGHRKSNLCVRRYFVTKNKMFQRGVFFINVFGLWSEKFALSREIIVLVLKPQFYVSWGTFSENIFVSKISFL